MIELEQVCKNYGLTKALIDVSFKIEKGQIVGFVGPNGAGKSTAMKIITTYTAPTSGTTKVGGYDVLENPLEVRQLIGYLPETVPLYADMLVDEYLHFIGEARHLNGKFKARYDWVVQAAGLEPVIHRKIGELSKGFKQRTCLAQALIHDPEVLILDEPTSGLDPLQIIGIRKLIKNLAHEKTIILSTHILPEVATISDRILVINDGRIVADGSFEDLRKQVTKQSSVYIAVKSSKKDFEAALKSVSGLEDVEYDDNRRRGEIGAHLFFKSSVDSVGKLNDLVRDNKWEILEFHPEKLSLEDSFIRLTQSTGSNDGGSKRAESVNEEGGAA
jgi:ABC-2 type transport system ATP-binding protein